MLYITLRTPIQSDCCTLRFLPLSASTNCSICSPLTPFVRTCSTIGPFHPFEGTCGCDTMSAAVFGASSVRAGQRRRLLLMALFFVFPVGAR